MSAVPAGLGFLHLCAPQRVLIGGADLDWFTANPRETARVRPLIEGELCACRGCDVVLVVKPLGSDRVSGLPARVISRGVIQ